MSLQKWILKFTIKNIHPLVIELFKAYKGIASLILHIIPLRSTDYNLSYRTDFSVNCVKTKHFGLNSLRCSASKKWDCFSIWFKYYYIFDQINRTDFCNWEKRVLRIMSPGIHWIHDFICSPSSKPVLAQTFLWKR